MAGVIGRTSSLPGARHPVPKGQTCDEHEGVPAVTRIQGETDSMGAELIDMCQLCVDKHEKHKQENTNPGICDWCNNHSTVRSKTRDPDEGSCGPVYDVCPPCRKKHNEAMQDSFE